MVGRYSCVGCSITTRMAGPGAFGGASGRGNTSQKLFQLALYATVLLLCASFQPALSADQAHQGSFFANNGSSSLLSGTSKKFRVWLNVSDFAVGFIGGHGNSFTFSVVSVLVGESGQLDLEIVWTTSGNFSIEEDAVVMLDEGGSLVLRSAGGDLLWSSGTGIPSGTIARLFNNGNLVLIGSNNDTVWQSFDHPTDTLMESQNFTSAMMLRSAVPNSNSFQGRYVLQTDSDGLGLYADIHSAQQYWKLSATQEQGQIHEGSLIYARLEPDGYIGMFQGGALVSYTRLNSYNQSISMRRMKLQADGNLRVFYWHMQSWNVDYEAFTDGSCQLPDVCGSYGVCSSTGECSCIGGVEYFKAANTSDWFDGGCVPLNPLSCDNSKAGQNFVKVVGMDYFAIEFSTQQPNVSSADECQSLCLGDCNCVASFFYMDTVSCYHTPELGSLMSTANVNRLAYIKVQNGLAMVSRSPSVSGSSFPFGIFIVGMSIVAVAIVLAGGLLFFAWFKRRAKRIEDSEEELFLEDVPGLPTRFSYRDLRFATGGFHKKVGAGVFGSVFEGMLPDGTRIVVKTLESIACSKQTFLSELAAINSIFHPNIVKVRGYGIEGAQGLLVYDYTLNGSLAKCLFQEHSVNFLLDWDCRFQISLDIARGLAFLHEGCGECMRHDNLKPENVLLDERLTARLSDFAIAKLFIADKEESRQMFVSVRNAQGYLAPEWAKDFATINEKSDVYSFGIVLLEIVSGRRVFDQSAGSDKSYLPSLAFDLMAEARVQELIDPRLKDLNMEQARRCVGVSLCCVQEDPHARPSMNRVEAMLLGSAQVPYCPDGREFAQMEKSRLTEEHGGLLKAAFRSALRASKRFTALELDHSSSSSLRK